MGCAAFGSCTFSGSTPDNANRTNNTEAHRLAHNSANEKTETAEASEDVVEIEAESRPVPTKAECEAIETGDNVVLKPQTFPLDFAPFAGSCFVTTYNPEFEDPPMESEIAIYTDGKRVYDLPRQFNGSTFGCWVGGVAFEDLNNDGETDIIVAGKCSARNAPYNENMVYVNTGTGFSTSEAANSTLIDLASTKAIAAHVKANRDKFFK